MAEGWFVTGTDTGIGKTVAATGLLRQLVRSGYRAAGMKPIASGCEAGPGGLRNEDALALQSASADAPPYERVNPYAFAPAVAPHLAAAAAGVTLDMEPIRDAYQRLADAYDVVVVEGAGGWHVPLDDRRTLAEIPAALGLGVILVVGLRLGCINHALLTEEAIRHRGLPLLGWIANDPGWETDDHGPVIEALDCRLSAPMLGRIPRLKNPSVAADYLALPVFG